MAGRSMQAARCPTDELSLSNCAVVNEKDFQSGLHVVVRTSPNHRYIFTLRTHSSVVPGSIAFSLPQRKWAGLSIGQDIDVSPYTFDKTKQCIGTMTIEIDFLQKKSVDANPYDTDKMAAEFIQQFNNLAFSVGQQLVFSFNDKLFGLLVKDIEAMDPSILKGEPGTSKKQKIDVGLILGNSQVAFEKAENSSLNLIGKSKTRENRQSIINPDWNFEKMGIGGLDREFSDIFRRAFASRVFPPEIVEQMGLPGTPVVNQDVILQSVMRTRKLPYALEKIWLDKHRYDEAERLYYEREAMLAASAPENCQEVEAVNSVCYDEPPEGELKDMKRIRNGKKQKKRKRSPKTRSLVCKVDFVLTGLLADRVWFDKPFFDRAENVFRKKLADDLTQKAPETDLAAEQPAFVSRSEETIPAVHEPRRNLAAMHCTHASLIACHHVIQGIWVNKFSFDDAEKEFVERSQSFVPPCFLDLPSVRWNSDYGDVGQRTPDEGYMTALATPATPCPSTDVVIHSGASFLTSLPSPAHQTVNGKPQILSLQALISEVWLEKPIYDDAERCFYENMTDGHPPGKVRPQERSRPEASRSSRKEKKGRIPGQRMNARHVEFTTDPPLPKDAECLPPTWYFLHKDSEPLWLSKPTYDRAESRYYASEALEMLSRQDNARVPEFMLAKPTRPASRAASVPASETK